MKRIFFLCLLSLLTVGCASMVPKELTNHFTNPMYDNVVLISIVAFHQQNGRWPGDIKELGLKDQIILAEQNRNNPNSQDITFRENPDGSLSIHFATPVEYSRNIVLTAPDSENSKYVGTYRPVEGAKYQLSGTMTIDASNLEASNYKVSGSISRNPPEPLK